VVAFPVEPAWARSNWQSLCVRLPSATETTALLARLDAAGIAARPGLSNAHEEPEQRDGVRAPLPQSERARRECVLLPLPSQMTREEQDALVAAVAG
jgi:perosamine synthetase